MYFYPSKLYFLFVLIALALTNASAIAGYYDFIKMDNNELADDQQNSLINKPLLNGVNRVVTSNMKKYPTVPKEGAFHFMNLSSGNDYKRLPSLFNQKSPSTMTVGRKIKHPDSNLTVADKQLHNTAAKNTGTQQTKNIKSVKRGPHSKNKIARKTQQSKRNVTQEKKRQKNKSIVLTDDKKMLPLNFGWPIKGKVLKQFSPSHNKGIDIAGKPGQWVKATEDGTVVYGGQGLIGFGKLLIIRHNDIYLSAYANNSRLIANEGEIVKKGQVIAKVGDVGIKRTSLHFEIRKNGKPVNPLDLLPKK